MNEQEYYDALDEIEKLVFDIAKDHLGTSFHVTKSNGYATTIAIADNPRPQIQQIQQIQQPEPVMIKKKIRVKRPPKVGVTANNQ